MDDDQIGLYKLVLNLVTKLFQATLCIEIFKIKVVYRDITVIRLIFENQRQNLTIYSNNFNVTHV